MHVDEANNPKRKAEEGSSPDEKDLELRAGEVPSDGGLVQTVVTPTATNAAPSQETLPVQPTTAASGSTEGGKPSPQASPQKQSEENLHEETKKARSDAMCAELEL